MGSVQAIALNLNHVQEILPEQDTVCLTKDSIVCLTWPGWQVESSRGDSIVDSHMLD